MKDYKYKWILLIIQCVITGTIAVQVYWNYKNYLSSKQQLINEVQLSLDTAVENYFANLAKKNTLKFAFTSDNDTLSNDIKLDSIIKNIQVFTNKKNHLDTLKNIEVDTIMEHLYQDESNNEWYSNRVILKKTSNDSIHFLNIDSFKTLTSKVLISMTRDSLKLDKIDSLLHNDLKRKQLNIVYGLTFKKDSATIKKVGDFNIDKNSLSINSKSTFLPKGSSLEIDFKNETQIILKRILGGILLSAFLILVIISSLYYMLKTIKHQKQLAEVKNDLISNITHEFKTPIATISAAIESIKNFNVIDDKEKTKTYLNMSSDQLSKLNVMVEKLLETATLDGDSLQLNKEETNITELINTLVSKHKMQTDDKTITLKSEQDVIIAKVDIFHFENTINNILDNAIKYGGNTISIHLSQTPIAFTVIISDNGNALTKAHKEKIFEKFYRVPKGNTHDVKGFGIGLYYSKKIAEKHGGVIHLDLNKNETTFKISLPNE